jgi:streptogramin lyase
MPTYPKTLTQFVLVTLLLAAILVVVTSARADLDVQETPLNSKGIAYEINPGLEGLLWISDNQEEEIWAFDPASGEYSVYHGAGKVSDARQAPDGSVWWVDQQDNSLGRLWPASGEATLWKIPGAANLLGTAIDEQGDVWLSEHFDPRLYHFDVASSQLCTYTLASIGGSDYPLIEDGDVWLGDWISDRIQRLDPDSGQLTSWTLPFMPGISYYPEGLDMDAGGNLWWADIDRHRLGRLEPELDRLTTYALPFGLSPNMVAVSGRRVWYTEGEEEPGSLGRLDPHLVTGSATNVSRETLTLTPSCASLSLDWSGKLTTTTGKVSWDTETYTSVVDSSGWWINQLPQDAFPWGIAASNGHIRLVDNGRQVLSHFQDSLSVAACKLADGDGDLASTGDQTPVEGWTIRLVADGQPVEPGQLTGATGCVVWDGLQPGVSYGVQEQVPSGWTALTPTSHEFGVLLPGEAYAYTFINTESATVRACSLSDADGDLSTTGDQAPLPGWTVFLHVDGVRQQTGAFTGADGCHTWGDLAPNHTYGVSQVTTSGWKTLTPSSYNFGLALPGDAFLGTFINRESNQRIYLPMIKR